VNSRFEFLGSTVIGQFIPKSSWFHQRDPRARLIFYSVIFFAVVFAPDLVGLAVGLIAAALIYIISHLPTRSTIKIMLRALPFILILAVLQIFFSKTQDADIVIGNIFGKEITQLAAINAMSLVCRFLVLIALINAMVMSISTSQVITAIFHLLKPFEAIGFPVNDFSMVVQITLRYLPLVAQLAEKTAKAQAARGGDWEQKGFNPIRQAKRVLPLIVPILVTSLRRAETMAIAMESRGFNASDERSSFYLLRFGWWDGLLLAASTALSCAILFLGKVF